MFIRIILQMFLIASILACGVFSFLGNLIMVFTAMHCLKTMECGIQDVCGFCIGVLIHMISSNIINGTSDYNDKLDNEEKIPPPSHTGYTYPFPPPNIPTVGYANQVVYVPTVSGNPVCTRLASGSYASFTTSHDGFCVQCGGVHTTYCPGRKPKNEKNNSGASQ